MLKEAIDKIVSLATPKTYNINGDTYTIDNNMRRIEPLINRPGNMHFSSLDGVVQAISAEIAREEIAKPIFVNVKSHDNVAVFTTLRGDNLCRDLLYTASPELPNPFHPWNDHESTIIALRSQFVPNEGTEYLLDLLSRISKEDAFSSEDNGVNQKVSVSTGIALRATVMVRPRVALAPFRTFLEVEQPESDFLVRVRGEPLQVGLIEADGGAWKLKAKKNIADYFRAHLKHLIERRHVIVSE